MQPIPTSHRLLLLLLFVLLSVLGLIVACQPPAPPSDAPLLATFTPTATPPSAVTATPTSLPFTPTPTPTPPPPTATVTPTLSPPPTATPLPTATPTPTGPVLLEALLTEAQLNELVRTALADAPNAAVQQVVIDTQPGHMLLTGESVLGFVRVRIGVIVTFDVRDGRLQPQIQSVLVNGQPTGGFIRQQIENMLLPYLDQLANTDLGIWVEEVEITEEALRLRGTRR